MGPLTIGVGELELGNYNAGSNSSGELTGFLLWTAGSGDYLTINAAGDKISINLI